MNKQPEDMIEGLFGSLSNLTKGDTVQLDSKDSTEVDLNRVIKDKVYALLTKDTLSPQEVTVLAALLQTIRVHN